jgi:hypothetical protein
MNKRIWGIIIVAAGILIIAGIAYFLFFAAQPLTTTISDTIGDLGKRAGPAVEEPKGELPAEPLKEEITKIVYEENKTAPAKITETDLKRIASTFAERFGSYSNQSNFGNINELKVFMSPSMQSWANGYVDEMRIQSGDSSLYYGITTKSVYQEVMEFDEDTGEAKILVKTQRRESTGTTKNSSTFNQDITISFKKLGQAWRVDSASWQTL